MLVHFFPYLYHVPPLGIFETMTTPRVHFFCKESLKQAFSWSAAAHVTVVAAAVGLGFVDGESPALVELEETIRFTPSFEKAPNLEMQESTDIPNPVPEPDAEFVDSEELVPLPDKPIAQPKSLNPASLLQLPHLPFPRNDARVTRRRLTPPKLERQPEASENPTPRQQETVATPPVTETFVAARQNRRGCPYPIYPTRALRRGLTGRCVLSIRVDDNGAVNWVRLRTSSGHGILDRAAMATVEKWHLTPATHGGLPVASERDISILFTLP